MRNFPMHFWRQFIQHKDLIALRSEHATEQTEINFATWGKTLQRVAIALMEQGLEQGSRVGLVADASFEWFTLAMATWLAGGCVVPIRHDLERRPTLRALARSGCDLIAISTTKKLDQLRGQGQLPDHLKWFVLHQQDNLPSTEHITSWKDLLEQGRFRELRGGDKQLAKRMYDAPTTNPTLILFDPEHTEDPHGAFFSGEQLAHYLDALGQDLRFDAQETLALAMNPGWFHALLLGVSALLQGHTLCVEPSGQHTIDALPTHHPTKLLVHTDYLEQKGQALREILEKQPDILQKIEEAPTQEAKKFSLLGALNTLGKQAALNSLYEPIRKELGKNLNQIFKVGPSLSEGVVELFEKLDIEVLSLHGYPEVGLTHMERPGTTKKGSVGRPVLGVSARIEGSKQEEDQGQLLIKTSFSMLGYWDGSGPRTIQDEWLHTTQQAYIKSGFLYLVQDDSTP